MFPFTFPFGGVTPSVFVGSNRVFNSTSAGFVTFPAGAVAGDVCLLFQHSDNVFTNPTGWNIIRSVVLDGAYRLGEYWKVLDATDIANGGAPHANNAGQSWGEVAVFRGGSTVTAKGSAAGVGGTSVSLPGTGATKSPNSRMMLVSAAFSPPNTPGTVTSPSPATGIVATFGGNYSCILVRYLPIDYTDGMAFTATLSNSYTGQARWLEIT